MAEVYGVFYLYRCNKLLNVHMRMNRNMYSILHGVAAGL